ncbi:hypothetical protein PCI56_11935 [Plesiomonas shigelloides subsp. oncorhynchi]|nr:hypothetical protein [Plesiomonas shigelloides]
MAGGASAEQLNLYFRTRIPTGMHLFERPVRVVLSQRIPNFLMISVGHWGLIT